MCYYIEVSLMEVLYTVLLYNELLLLIPVVVVL